MKRVFSGARPTGRQHIGNYLGAIQNYVKLQDAYECVYCIVDIHALTTLKDTSQLQAHIREMTLDWLAAGLDPQRSIIFVQSHVPEVMQLYTLLGMVTPLGWLLRVPTFKEKARLQPENVNYGLVGYPVLMTADIVLYKAEVVPVGEDQLPHLELAREIVRRFNTIYGETFPEPTAKLTQFAMVLGLDGKEKMSKQLGNDIELALSEEETRQRVMTAVTDPARQRRHDPGHPEVCNVFKLHRYFHSPRLDEIEPECRSAAIGCVECKKLLAEEINAALRPFRERRAALAARPGYVAEVLADGARRAQAIARPTLAEVKAKMGLLERPGRPERGVPIEVIPAIDLRHGKCVRLYQGDYAREMVFSEDPVDVALKWQGMGAPRLHIVDLDGAAAGELVNMNVISEIAGAVLIPVQLGGGIRDVATVEKLLKAGIDRVVLGTVAVEHPDVVREACQRYSESIIVSIDTREGYVATRGWQQAVELQAAEFAKRMIEVGVKRFIFTDITRDGTLTEPNFTAIAELLDEVRVPIIAAGGISRLTHLKILKKLGVEGTIVGRALYSGEINLKQALETIGQMGATPAVHEPG